MHQSMQRQPSSRQSRRSQSHSTSRHQMHRDYAQALHQPQASSLRNAWVDQHHYHLSSSSSCEVHTGPPPASTWLRPPTFPSNPTAFTRQQVYPTLQTNHQNPITSIGRSSAVSSTPTDLSTHQDACSSRASACDSFCYHCLQVVYIAGILTGISLIIAGSVLKGGQRRSNLFVLFYIGILLSAVSVVLLTIHLVVRRNVRKRRKRLRSGHYRARPILGNNQPQEIPLHEFVSVPGTSAHSHQYVPLVHGQLR